MKTRELAASLLLLGATLNTGFSEQTPPTKACCSKPVAAEAPLPDKSLYQLESRWTNDRGQTVELRSFAGRPVFITMFFARCIYACPVLVNDAKKIEAQLPETIRSKAIFLMVSIDTEGDSVEVLADFRKRHKLGDNWHLLRGSEGDVLELAALLGVKYVRENSGQFAHSNLISLLNPQGELVFQQSGLNREPETALNALQKWIIR